MFVSFPLASLKIQWWSNQICQAIWVPMSYSCITNRFDVRICWTRSAICERVLELKPEYLCRVREAIGLLAPPQVCRTRLSTNTMHQKVYTREHTSQRTTSTSRTMSRSHPRQSMQVLSWLSKLSSDLCKSSSLGLFRSTKYFTDAGGPHLGAR